jgi:hypothetical protein
MKKIASATVILADEKDFAGMNEEWMRWFPSNPSAHQGAKLPARIPASRFQSRLSLRLKKGPLKSLVSSPVSGATNVDVSFDKGSVCDGYSRDDRISTHRPLASNVKVIACLAVPSNLSKHNYFIRCHQSLRLTGSSHRDRLSGKRNGTFNSTIDMHSLHTCHLTFEDESLAYQRLMYVCFYHSMPSWAQGGFSLLMIFTISGVYSPGHNTFVLRSSLPRNTVFR